MSNYYEKLEVHPKSTENVNDHFLLIVKFWCWLRWYLVLYLALCFLDLKVAGTVYICQFPGINPLPFEVAWTVMHCISDGKCMNHWCLSILMLSMLNSFSPGKSLYKKDQMCKSEHYYVCCLSAVWAHRMNVGHLNSEQWCVTSGMDCTSILLAWMTFSHLGNLIEAVRFCINYGSTLVVEHWAQNEGVNLYVQLYTPKALFRVI